MVRTLTVLAVCWLALGATRASAQEVQSDTSGELLERLEKYHELLERNDFKSARGLSQDVLQQHPEDPVARLMHEHTLLIEAQRNSGLQFGLTSNSRALVPMVYSVADLVTVSAESKKPEFAPLVELLTNTVAPGSWAAKGGSADIRSFEQTLSLVIRQTPAVHQEVAVVLSRLRRERQPKVVLDVRFLELSRGAAYWGKLEIDLNKSSQILTDAQAAAIAKDSRATLLAQPKLVIPNGETAEIRLPTPGTRPECSLLAIANLGEDHRTVRLKLAANCQQLQDVLTSAIETEIQDGVTILIRAHGSVPDNGSRKDNRIGYGPEAPAQTVVLVTPHVVEYEKPEQHLYGTPRFDALQSIPPRQVPEQIK
jgi:hypothetical protein